MARVILLSSVLIGLFLPACGGKKDSHDGPTSNAIYAAARNITPAVATGAGAHALAARPAAADAAMPWWSGNLGGLIFQTLRDYQYPRDEGQVDATNIYKVLFEAGNTFERGFGSLDAIAEKPVASPFDFGPFSISDTYDKAKNGVEGNPVFMAARQAGNDKHLLVAMSTGNASSIMQGAYLGDTKDLELNSMTVIRYTAGSMAGDVYGIRSYIKGNEATHTFTFRFLQFSYNHAMDMNYYYSVIGTGVSQGAGGHFLFFGSGSNAPSSWGPATGYWCFASGDSEAQYQAKFTAYPPAQTEGGETIAADSPCLGYKEGAEGIDAQLAAHPLWGPSDVTFDPATFTGGGSTRLELTF